MVSGESDHEVYDVTSIRRILAGFRRMGLNLSTGEYFKSDII